MRAHRAAVEEFAQRFLVVGAAMVEQQHELLGMARAHIHLHGSVIVYRHHISIITTTADRVPAQHTPSGQFRVRTWRIQAHRVPHYVVCTCETIGSMRTAHPDRTRRVLSSGLGRVCAPTHTTAQYVHEYAKA